MNHVGSFCIWHMHKNAKIYIPHLSKTFPRIYATLGMWRGILIVEYCPVCHLQQWLSIFSGTNTFDLMFNILNFELWFLKLKIIGRCLSATYTEMKESDEFDKHSTKFRLKSLPGVNFTLFPQFRIYYGISVFSGYISGELHGSQLKFKWKLMILFWDMMVKHFTCTECYVLNVTLAE